MKFTIGSCQYMLIDFFLTKRKYITDQAMFRVHVFHVQLLTFYIRYSNEIYKYLILEY